MKDGTPIGVLSELQEEYATLFQKDIENCKVDEVYLKNFTKDFKKLKGLRLKNISDCNFSNLLPINDLKITKGSKYQYCYVNNTRRKVTNFRIEPPSIFKGRGDHPLRGKIKKRISETDVQYNYDCKIEWIAMYKDSLSGKPKYICADSSGESDHAKFEKARALKKKIKKIRLINETNLKHPYDDQLATCVYLIDKLCIRAGNEKEKDTAETVGCCTLKTDHISFSAKNSICLNFLGKDSIPFSKQFKVPDDVFNNLSKYAKKGKNKALFDRVDTNKLNNYLGSLLPGLTAKVFRTCNASVLFETSLKNGGTMNDYLQANRQVAELCNHKTNGKLSLSTSRINYLDPRISVSFCKQNKIPIAKVFSSSMKHKHKWAFSHSYPFKF
jgi:DNA topoisomerase-1